MTARAMPVRPEPSPLQNIERLTDRCDSFAFLSRYAKRLGFVWFALFHLAGDAEKPSAGEMLVTNIPDPVRQALGAAQGSSNSYTLALAAGGVAPVAWFSNRAIEHRPETAANGIVELLEAHSITGGVHVPVHDRRGARGVATMMGSRVDTPSFPEMSELALVASALFDKIASFKPQAKVAARLSERERECLVWTAAGKTSAEIGLILGLSEHTINQYIAACCQKLGTVNRVQAVAGAIRTGIIS